MNNEQIAHDLAVAKLYGSELKIEELIKQYRKYYEEILLYLKTEPKQADRTVKIIKSPI